MTYSHDVALQFLRVVRQLAAHIARYPEAHEVVYQDVRMAVSQELPYSVFYTYESGQVTVFAVMHQRRDPRDWQVRVK
jgi:plasmid stabilization system protein ParE